MVSCRRIAFYFHVGCFSGQIHPVRSFYFGVGYFSGITVLRMEEFDNFVTKELEYGQFNIGYRQSLGSVLARHFRHESVLR